MNKKIALGLFSVLMVTAHVACGDDSSSTSAPVEDSVPVDPTQSSSSDVILNESEGSSSSSSNVILNGSEGSSSSNSANSSSSNAANSSSSVILNGSEGSSSSNNILYSSSSEWRGGECINQEGDTRYDEMYEFQCKNEKWVIIGYRPGACVGDMDCGFSDGSAEQTRCKNVTVDNIKVEGSVCSIAVDGYHKSESGCEFFCDGSKWIYTPPPMAL